MHADQPDHHSPPSIRRWMLVMGAGGFLAGYLGPIFLSPEANQGPLLGIFITGPGGVIAGLVLGTLFRALPVSDALARQALAVSCGVLVLGTLFACLPEPATIGQVIDAEAKQCAPPMDSADAAVQRWKENVARTTWHTPPADWQQTAVAKLRGDSGAVLRVHIVRRSILYRHRKPWNRGRLSAGPWTPVAAPEEYYVRDPYQCSAFVAQGRALYLPFSGDESGPERPAKSWPPTDVPGFLGLMELGAVPEEYARILK